MRTGRSSSRYSLNKRTGIILLSIALAFFIGIIVKYLVLGK